jgi:hypothetical protein
LAPQVGFEPRVSRLRQTSRTHSILIASELRTESVRAASARFAPGRGTVETAWNLEQAAPRGIRSPPASRQTRARGTSMPWVAGSRTLLDRCPGQTASVVGRPDRRPPQAASLFRRRLSPPACVWVWRSVAGSKAEASAGRREPGGRGAPCKRCSPSWARLIAKVPESARLHRLRPPHEHRRLPHRRLRHPPHPGSPRAQHARSGKAAAPAARSCVAPSTARAGACRRSGSDRTRPEPVLDRPRPSGVASPRVAAAGPPMPEAHSSDRRSCRRAPAAPPACSLPRWRRKRRRRAGRQPARRIWIQVFAGLLFGVFVFVFVF